MAVPLCIVDDVEARLGVDIEPGTPEYSRVYSACNYTSAVLRARFPMIPTTFVPDPVNLVATEVTVRYLGADPATGGMVSETIGAYTYRRASGMGSMALTDDEYAVLSPYGLPALLTLVKSNGYGVSTCRCGYGPDVECLAVGHAPTAPLAAGTWIR